MTVSLAVLAVLVLASLGGHLCLANGEVFVGTDIMVIREQAQLMFDIQDAGSNEWIVVPDLTFSCAGSISVIWFLARETGSSSDTVFPEFQLWTNGNIIDIGLLKTYEGRIKDSRSPDSQSSLILIESNGDVGLYKYTLQQPLQFASGDVFGMRHFDSSAITVQFQSSGGFENYHSIVLSSTAFQYVPGQHRYPLVSVGDIDCGAPFLSVDGLQQLLGRESRERSNAIQDIPLDGLSYIFPSLQFTTSRLVEKWVFAATRSIDSPSIEFQIWRRTAEQTRVYSTTVRRAPTRTGYANLYEFPLDPPQLVQAGDFIGVSVSGLQDLRPQWIPGTGPEYQRVLKPVDGLEVFSNIATLGNAIPLFAAQLQEISDDPSPLPSTSLPIPHPPPPTSSILASSRPSEGTTFVTIQTSTYTASIHLPMPPSTTVIPFPTGRMEESTEDDSPTLAIAIAAGVGVLFILAIITLLMLAAVCLGVRHRHSKSKDDVTNESAQSASNEENSLDNIQISFNTAYASPTGLTDTTPNDNPNDVTTTVWNVDYMSAGSLETTTTNRRESPIYEELK